MKGHFITFEGGDGAGKTTLIQSLHKALLERGHDVIETRAPGGTEAGKVIRKLLLHPDEVLAPRAELLLFLADRSQQLEKVILPALREGKVVLCDRYNDSTIAYQGYARGFDVATVEDLCSFATDHLKPHLTLYLDLDPEVGLERVKNASDGKDQIEAEALSFHQTIRKAFHTIAEKEPTRFQILDAAQSKEDVFQEAMRLIDVHCFAANP